MTSLKSCILSSKLNMQADLYESTIEYNDYGQTEYSWDRDNPIVVRTLVRGIMTGGIRAMGSTQQWGGEDFEDVEWAKMYVASLELPGDRMLVKSMRVSNIRNDEGDVLWLHETDPGVVEPLEFNIEGIQPITDPFGTPLEYEIIIKGVTGD